MNVYPACDAEFLERREYGIQKEFLDVDAHVIRRKVDINLHIKEPLSGVESGSLMFWKKTSVS